MIDWYGRHIELFEISEVSPPDAVTRNISAGVVQGVAEQWSVEGADTASPPRLEKEGPRIDIAKILSVTGQEAQVKVPETLWEKVLILIAIAM